MADVQYDQQPPNERVAHRAALQVVPTIPLAVSIVPIEVETVQPMQIGMATPRAGVSEPQGSAEAPVPAAVVIWTEEQLLELTTSLPAMRTIRHQPRGLSTILKKLLERHTHCHHQRIKRRDSESLQAEVAAARWTWLGPSLLVRAYEAVIMRMTKERRPGSGESSALSWRASERHWPRQARGQSSCVCTCAICSPVRLTRAEMARTPCSRSTTLKADTMRASDKMDSCNIRSFTNSSDQHTRTADHTDSRCGAVTRCC